MSRPIMWNFVRNGLDTPSSTDLEFTSNIVCLKNYQLAQLGVGRRLYVSKEFHKLFPPKKWPPVKRIKNFFLASCSLGS